MKPYVLVAGGSYRLIDRGDSEVPRFAIEYLQGIDAMGRRRWATVGELADCPAARAVVWDLGCGLAMARKRRRRDAARRRRAAR